MAKEKVEEGKGEKEVDVKVAKIELGNKHTATIIIDFPDTKEGKKKMNFKLKVHQPTMVEDLRIAVKEEEILGSKTGDQFIILAARMLATLDICIDEIWFEDEGEFKRFYGTFIQLTNKVKAIQQFYKEVVFPTYDQFLAFTNEIEMDFDELKNDLAQTGKG